MEKNKRQSVTRFARLDVGFKGKIIMDKKRNVLWDVMKGIGIILVVAGHAIQYGSGREYLHANCYFENGIFAFIYSFHMPMLMLCSGYLFLGDFFI